MAEAHPFEVMAQVGRAQSELLIQVQGEVAATRLAMDRVEAAWAARSAAVASRRSCWGVESWLGLSGLEMSLNMKVPFSCAAPA